MYCGQWGVGGRGVEIALSYPVGVEGGGYEGSEAYVTRSRRGGTIVVMSSGQQQATKCND